VTLCSSFKFLGSKAEYLTFNVEMEPRAKILLPKAKNSGSAAKIKKACGHVLK